MDSFHAMVDTAWTSMHDTDPFHRQMLASHSSKVDKLEFPIYRAHQAQDGNLARPSFALRQSLGGLTVDAT